MYKLVSLLTATAIFIGFTSFKHHSMQDHITKKTGDGWITLFDGKTTNGWHTYGMKTAGNVWKVENGVLHLDQSTANKQSGDLVTNDEYKNFDLKLDWKISEKGNSGIIFYVHEDPAKYNETYVTGIEMQILDNGSPTRLGHPDGKYYTHRAGDLYDLMASKEVANPLGQWNNVEIKCKDGKLDFYMNGQHTLSTTLWDQHWKEMVAISKFKSMPAFATFKEGKIALQDHGGDVWFRNIKIKKL
ncbi:MAG: 3-keto-disaccharide hydrolase [Ginsengibacter sp.]